MTPGIVVTIRINPKDAMAVIDCLDFLGIPKHNLSFSQAAKLVLSSALESYRQQGTVPIRTGFEYSQMVEPFNRGGFASRGAKLATAKLLRGEHIQPEPIIPETYERRAKRLRYEELKFKKENAPLNWTEEEQEEFKPLVMEFF